MGASTGKAGGGRGKVEGGEKRVDDVTTDDAKAKEAAGAAPDPVLDVSGGEASGTAYRNEAKNFDHGVGARNATHGNGVHGKSPTSRWSFESKKKDEKSERDFEFGPFFSLPDNLFPESEALKQRTILSDPSEVIEKRVEAAEVLNAEGLLTSEEAWVIADETERLAAESGDLWRVPENVNLYLRTARIVRELGGPIDVSAAVTNFLNAMTPDTRDLGLTTTFEEIGIEAATSHGREGALRMLNDPSLFPEFRAGIAFGLSHEWASEAISDLERIARDPLEEDGLRLAAAKSLCALREKDRAIPVLEGLLSSPSLHVSLGAAEILVDFGETDRALPVLRLLAENDLDVLQEDVVGRTERREPFSEQDVQAFVVFQWRTAKAIERGERVQREKHVPERVQMGKVVSMGVRALASMPGIHAYFARDRLKSLAPDAVGVIAHAAAAGEKDTVRALIILARNGNVPAMDAVKVLPADWLIVSSDPESVRLVGELAALGHVGAAEARIRGSN